MKEFALSSKTGLQTLALLTEVLEKTEKLNTY